MESNLSSGCAKKVTTFPRVRQETKQVTRKKGRLLLLLRKNHACMYSIDKMYLFIQLGMKTCVSSKQTTFQWLIRPSRRVPTLLFTSLLARRRCQRSPSRHSMMMIMMVDGRRIDGTRKNGHHGGIVARLRHWQTTLHGDRMTKMRHPSLPGRHHASRTRRMRQHGVVSPLGW